MIGTSIFSLPNLDTPPSSERIDSKALLPVLPEISIFFLVKITIIIESNISNATHGNREKPINKG
jgi:hypothetical protein